MHHQLIAMHNNAHVILKSYSFQTHWECEVESKDESLAFKLVGKGPTPDEAVDDAFAKWNRITRAVPEFLGMLPPPAIEDAHDGDAMIEPIDDEIPF